MEARAENIQTKVFGDPSQVPGSAYQSSNTEI
jgi:hypothetical protein